MASPAAILPASDPRWYCRNLVEVVSESFDLDRGGVGSSPYVGDMSNIGVRVPEAPTTSQSNRYLIRLAGIQIPQGRGIILHGLRQAATIRCEQLLANCQPLVTELEITSPFWSFPDGNISWHLRLTPNRFAPATYDPNQRPGTDPNLNRLDTALLYRPPLLPYRAPNAGIPPGAAADFLGTWYGLRYPWENTDWKLHVVIPGPYNLVFYASVHQTNPDGRAIAVVADPGAMRREDRFLAQFQEAIYGRVAGAMLIETLPECKI